MYFKLIKLSCILKLRNLVGLIGLLGAFAFTNSCRWVGEKKPEPLKLEIKNQINGCFANLSGVLESYLKSEIKDEEIEGFFACTEESINDFMRKTRERDSGKGYSRLEIESLLRTFMLKDKSELNSQRYSKIFLIMKRALVGGDLDHFNKSDWSKIKVLIPVLKRFVYETRSYMRFYYFYNRLNYCEPDVNGVCQSADDFKRIDLSHKAFEEKLKVFLHELKEAGSLLNKNEIINVKEELVTFEHVKKLNPLLEEIIHIFYSFPISDQPENWGELFRLAEYGLRIMTYAKRSVMQNESFFVPEGGVALAAMIKSVIAAFDMAYRINSSLDLNQELIERLVVALSDSGLFLSKVENKDSVRDAIAKIGRNIVTSDTAGSWYISNSKLSHLKFMHNRWVNTLIESLEDSTMRDLREKYRELLFQNVDYEVNSEQQGEDVFANVVKPSYVNLVFPGEEYKINFQIPNTNSQIKTVTSNFYKAMMSNVVLLVFDTYGRQFREDQNSQKYVVEQAAKNFYNDIRQIVVSEGMGSPLSCDAGGRTFLEANLFGFSSNGNDRIEVQEGLEWLTMATSSSSVANKLFNNIAAIPDCVLPGRSVFQKRPYLKQECVRSYILSNYSRYFNHLPNLVRYIEAEGNAEEFYRNIFEVTRTCRTFELPISYDEIIYSVTLLGYIESLFERYDSDRPGLFRSNPKNDLLEYDELQMAYEERFKSILRRMARMQSGIELSESRAAHLFKKLLILKQMPPIPQGTVEGVNWLITHRLSPVVPLTRIDVYKVFNSILTMGEQPASSQEYCTNLKLAWETYLDQQIFEVTIPQTTCVIAPPQSQ